MNLSLRAALSLSLLATFASAQEKKRDEEFLPGHSVHGEAFNEGPRQKAYLMEGMGKIKFEITTRDAEAQKLFLQGVGQLHGFYYFESERSFRQIARLDPDCAMAYWGMAMANINNEKRAKDFIAKADKLKDKAGPREKLWIASLVEYYKVPPAEKEKRARTYIRALENVVREYPDEIEAKAFLVWAIWYHKDKGLPIGSVQAVDSLIQDVLRVEPMHNGIHHYRIHLWDEEKPAVALGSAELFGPASAGIAHAWHMPGHIYSKLHRYADAARQQEASARVDHAHMIADATLPYQIHNYAHNNQWCVTDLGYIGRVKDAIAISENLIEQPRHPKFNHNDQPEGCFRVGRTRLFETLIKWEKWNELLARAETTLAPIDQRDDKIRRLRALGAAAFGESKMELGNKYLAELQEMIQKEPAAEGADAKKKEEAEKAREANLKPVRNAVEELNGRMKWAELDYKTALEHFAKCEDLHKEILAQAQFLEGEHEKGIKTAKAAADAAPGQLYPLAAYVELLLRLGKDKEAIEGPLKSLRELAAFADPGLAIFERIGEASLPPNTAKRWPDQSNLGPIAWRPSVANFWSLPDARGGNFGLEVAAENPVLVLFYLGSSCRHCVEQLGKFAALHDEFAKANITIVAVSTETGEEIKRACDSDPKKNFPFTMLADPEKKVFKMYRCWDDFENAPLHGTFLIDASDRSRGRIRWQDISYEPFMDAKFLLEESKRLLALKVQ